MRAHGIDLDQWHRRNRCPEAHGEKVQPGAEHQHAIGLIHHASAHGVREGPEDAEVVGMAVEHVLAASRGHQQGARFFRQGYQSGLGASSMCSHAGHDQRAPALAEKSHDGVDGLSAGSRWLGSGEGRRRGFARDLHVHHLDVGGQEQRSQGALIGGGHGIAQGLACGRRAGGGETRQPRRAQHGLSVEALVVGTDGVDGSALHGGVAIDHQHLRSHATGRHRRM